MLLLLRHAARYAVTCCSCATLLLLSLSFQSLKRLPLPFAQVRLRGGRRADALLAQLNQVKQSMAAPDWELDDFEWCACAFAGVHDPVRIWCTAGGDGARQFRLCRLRDMCISKQGHDQIPPARDRNTLRPLEYRQCTITQAADVPAQHEAGAPACADARGRRPPRRAGRLHPGTFTAVSRCHSLLRQRQSRRAALD